jgi:cystathionine gamma-synthase
MNPIDPRGHTSDECSVESWLVSALAATIALGSPLNVPPYPASNFVLAERRVYSRGDGTPGWDALEEIVGGLEGVSAVAFSSGAAAERPSGWGERRPPRRWLA